MILQTDNLLNESGLPFEKFGCTFLCIAYWCNQISKKSKLQPYLISIAKEAIRLEYIDDELKIIEWEKVFSLFGVKVKYYGHCKQDQECKENEFEILKWKKPKHTHFTCGDGEGHKTYDSLGIRAASRAYKLEGKRIFKIL